MGGVYSLIFARILQSFCQLPDTRFRCEYSHHSLVVPEDRELLLTDLDRASAELNPMSAVVVPWNLSHRPSHT